MKGFIRIEAVTRNGQEGLSIETHVQNLSAFNELEVLNAICTSLHVDDRALKVFTAMKLSGLFDQITEMETVQESLTEVEIDIDAILKQLGGGDECEG